jgi:hypothetical protein
MPKFEVCVTITRDLTFEVEAINEEEAAKTVLESNSLDPIRETDAEQHVKSTVRKLEPHEIALKMQIENIRRDYEQLDSYNTLPSGEIIDAASGKTILAHLAKLHDALVTQSGLQIPPLGDGEGLVSEHIGQPEPAPIEFGEDPQAIWEKAASKLGWHWDPDYKGWIKPANRRPGKVHGEWDAYVRDMEAEDACNEEGIDTVEEAKGVILGRPRPEGVEH